MNDRESRSIEVTGVVVELLPRALVRVEIEGPRQIVAHVAETRRKNFVRLVEGDTVRVELAPHDVTRGRITERVAEGRRG